MVKNRHDIRRLIVSLQAICRRNFHYASFRVVFLITTMLIIVACNQQNYPPNVAKNKAESVLKEFHNPSSRYVVVVAHRGDWRNYPENSLAAIESVIRMGVDVVEVDIKMTKDSVLVLSHDHTLDRTTTGSGNISNYTYQQLLAFDLKRGHGIAIPGMKIPTLRQALQICKDRIVVNVDHAYDYYEQVLSLTEELNMTEQVLMKSGKPYGEVQKKLSSFPNNMMYMPVISVTTPDRMQTFNEYIMAQPLPLAFEICFDSLTELVRKTANEITQSKSKIWVNTIWASLCGGYDDDSAYDNGPKVYDTILALGTSIIQTDRPEFLIKYLEKVGRRKFSH